MRALPVCRLVISKVAVWPSFISSGGAYRPDGSPRRPSAPPPDTSLFRFGQADDAALVSGVGADDLSIQLADLELDAANALPGFLVLF